jgi:D-alanyl-D-alanine carboxypeptidase/D-alanyl-D-alanine-endopeptidase (penicillin-binding protein 4)
MNGALVVNFNTINVRRDAGGTVYSGEPVTPLTPLARTKAAAISPGTSQRINLTRDENECLQYAGELFGTLLGRTSVAVDVGEVDDEERHRWRLIHTHENTRNLSDVVKGLMKYSNNFIANQIFLTVGATKLGYPAALEKSVTFYREYMKNELQLSPEEVTLVEGSGISRTNRITASTMIKVLKKFADHAELLPANGTALVKSGTLSGVYNYAGYIKTSRGLRPFVIILNQRRNTRDSILKVLARYCED